jgi:hypothetical protein
MEAKEITKGKRHKSKKYEQYYGEPYQPIMEKEKRRTERDE